MGVKYSKLPNLQNPSKDKPHCPWQMAYNFYIWNTICRVPKLYTYLALNFFSVWVIMYLVAPVLYNVPSRSFYFLLPTHSSPQPDAPNFLLPQSTAWPAWDGIPFHQVLRRSSDICLLSFPLPRDHWIPTWCLQNTWRMNSLVFHLINCLSSNSKMSLILLRTPYLIRAYSPTEYYWVLQHRSKHPQPHSKDTEI